MTVTVVVAILIIMMISTTTVGDNTIPYTTHTIPCC